MLQTVTPQRYDTFDPLGYTMGPIATLGCQVSLGFSFLWIFGVFYSLLLPISYGILSLFPVLGALFITPRIIISRYPVSLSVLCIFLVMSISAFWTINSPATSVAIKTFMPATLAMILAAGLLTKDQITEALLWAIRVTLLITIFAIATMPAARTHLGAEGVAPLPGWHGLFLHKNQMTPVLIFSFVTTLAFHKAGYLKWLTIGAITILMFGSTSATGISATMLIALAWIWLKTYSNQEDARNSTVFITISALGFVGMVLGIFASLATITSAYGKDLTFSGRTDIWVASLQTIKERPLLGHGLGGLFSQEHLSPETQAFWRIVGFEANHAHNGALDLALQIGLLGLAIFFVIWITTFRRGWKILSTDSNLGAWVLCVLSAQMFISLSENVYLGGWIALLAVLKLLLLNERNNQLRTRPQD